MVGGLALGLAGLFTTAAGLLAPLSCGLWAGCWVWRQHARRQRDLIVAVLAGAVVLIGWMVRVEVPGHAWLHAQSIGIFLRVLLHSLAWPGIEFLFLGFLLWAPFVVLAVQLARGRVARSPSTDLAIVLGLWTILHAAGIAWARGTGMEGQLP